MRSFAPIALVAVAATSLSACYLPPLVVPGTSVSDKYALFAPGYIEGVALPKGIAAFADTQVPPTSIAVPDQAHGLNIPVLTLILKLTNSGPLPLQVRVYLGPTTATATDIYSTPALGSEIVLPAGAQQQETDLSVDSALLQNQQVSLGFTIGSPGTTQSVTFQASDAVTIDSSMHAQIRAF